MDASLQALRDWLADHSAARLIKLWSDIRASYWFLPTLMTFGGIAASSLTILLDVNLDAELLSSIPFLYINQPEGARAVLSTIAGSMITVAGVTFSITIASVVYASSQYGPRILSNFMQDRGNQVTLGTFIATFVYCLLVLRTVRSANESAEAGFASEAFVPHLSVVGGIVLALLSVGVLIYFIHHIASAIHLPNVVSGIGETVMRRIEDLYPEHVGFPPPDETEETGLPHGFVGEAAPVEADGTGYVQALDSNRLMEIAGHHDLILRVMYRPGNFVHRGRPLVLAWPANQVTDKAKEAIRRSFAWGTQRTSLQDVLFPVDELVEIAARALSPGVNDPFTAMNCLDWLGAALAEIIRRGVPDVRRFDDQGRLRIVTHPVSVLDFIDAVFGQLLPYVQGDRNATLHMLKVLGEIAQRADEEDERHRLLYYADNLRDPEGKRLASLRDREEVEYRYHVVREILENPGRNLSLDEANRWVGGSA